MENKKLRINESVLIFASDCGNFEIVRGTITGGRKYETAFGNFIYLIETPIGTYERYEMDVFRSVEEIQQEIPNRVIG